MLALIYVGACRKEDCVLKDTLMLLWSRGHLNEGNSLGSSSIRVLLGTYNKDRPKDTKEDQREPVS